MIRSNYTGSEQWKSLGDLSRLRARTTLGKVNDARESKSALYLQSLDHNNLAHEGFSVRDYGTFVTPFALALGMRTGTSDAAEASTTTQAIPASPADTLPPSRPASSANLSSGIPSRAPSGFSLASGELLTAEDLQQVSHLRNTMITWSKSSDSEDDEGLMMKIPVREGRGRKA